MQQRGTELALDIVADDRQSLLCELLCELRLGSDEDLHTIDQGDTRIKTGPCVVVA